MSFEERLSECATLIQAKFDQTLSILDQDQDVVQAMAYATCGGKRLRGFFVMEGSRLHGIADDISVNAAVAIEAMHAYSLVHDDLPAMDDDDLRRGQPTVHRKWDDATAILAGDALQSFAFSQLVSLQLPCERVVGMVAMLAKASGAQGMVLGQALDIAAEKGSTQLDLDQITRMQRGKTGALLEWSTTAGARMSGGVISPLLRYGQSLGLAFQIADDILDVEGDEAKTGKRVQKDDAAGKATFVSLLGLEGAKERARALVADALHVLTPYGAEADNLRDAARFVISREF